MVQTPALAGTHTVDTDALDSFERLIEDQGASNERHALGLPRSFASTALSTSRARTVASAAPRRPGTVSSTALVPRQQAHEFSGHDALWLNDSELSKVQQCARVDPLSRPSMLNALAFKCGSPTCKDRQCTKQLDELNVLHLRQTWAIDCASEGYGASGSKEAMISVLQNRFDQQNKTFEKCVVRVVRRNGIEENISLCISSWAIVVANVGHSTFTKVRADVSSGRSLQLSMGAPSSLPAKRLKLGLEDDKKSGGEKVESTFRMLKSYVRELATTLEHNPAPGAMRQIEYIAPRETWEQRAAACRAKFAEQGIDLAVDRRQLQMAWKCMGSLIDKTMKSHSKCDDCAWYDSQWSAVIGRTREEFVTLREKIKEAKIAHRKLCADERGELDDSGYRSIMYPPLEATAIADGATQRNFMLPKLSRKRLPKELARKNLFNCKLYGVFIYGYGMTCYVLHESVGGGPNLTCTALYRALMDAFNSGRPLPEVLHFQLDNTGSENKCITVFCFAGWLVSKKWVKRVRIFFLMKGHTHVIIDQCFGSITKSIRSNNVLSLDDLLQHIWKVINNSKKYQGRKVERMHHLFDFASFFSNAHTGIGGFATSNFNPDGYHDFHVTLNDEGHAVLNLKRYASTPDFVAEANGGFRIFKDGAFDALPSEPPRADVKGDDQWDRAEFAATYRAFEQYFGLSNDELTKLREKWTATMDDTAASTSALLQKNIISFPYPIVNDQRIIAQPLISVQHVSRALAADVSNPPVCTVHGGGRSQALVNKEIEAWLVAQRGSQPVPTTPLSTFSLYATDLLLVDRGNETPVLCCISKRIQGHLPPNSLAVEVKCVSFTCRGEGEASFFGPYCRSSPESFTISRAEILVYNVGFLKMNNKKSKDKYLSEETISALSDVKPAFVERISTSKPPVYTLGQDDAQQIQQRSRKQPIRRRPASSSDDSSDEEEVEDDENGEEDADEAPLADSSDEAGDGGENDDFALTGCRRKGEYVWIDLEGDASMAAFKPPIGLGFCEEDEANQKVKISWFAAYKWKGSLSVQHSTFAKYYTNKTDYVRAFDNIAVGAIVPIRVELLYEKGEFVRITPNSIHAVLEWCKHKSAVAKPKKSKQKGR